MLSQTYLYKISKYLAYFVYQVELENKANNFDINRHAERFFIPILNIIFRADFKRLEFEQLNYPAVDVGDADKGIAIQVTSQKGFGKITHTLSRYVAHRLYEQFPELYHLVIDMGYQTTKSQADVDQYIQDEVAKLTLDPAPSVIFPISNRLINIGQLRLLIEQQCDVTQLAEIAAFLESEYGEVTALPTFNDPLLPYRIAFGKQLNTANDQLTFQFHNPFIGRQGDVEVLRAFVEDPAQKVLAVAAEGGYGKTRLCIEYFIRHVDGDAGKEAFVVDELNFNPAALAETLTGDKIFILLLDDAHKDPAMLRSLVDVVSRLPKAKLLLTVRKALLDETLRQLPTHGRDIAIHRLERLSYEETKAMFRAQLFGMRDEFIVRFTEQARGVPAVILSICQRVADGADPQALAADFNFAQFVTELTDQTVADISKKTYIDREKIYKTIQLISLCGPVSDTGDELSLLGTVNQVDAEETEIIIDELRSAGFVSPSLRIAIQPDPYSDVIITNSLSRVAALLKNPQLAPFRERIIKNLMLLQVEGRVETQLNAMLAELIRDMETAARAGEYRSLNEGLEVLLSFAYKRPELAIEVLARLSPAFQGVEQPAANDIWGGMSLKSVFENLERLCAIAMLNTHGEAALEHNYQVVLGYSKPGDPSMLRAAFRYKEYDFREFNYAPPQPCERQQFLGRKLTALVAADHLDPTQQELALSGFSILLNPEITLETHYEQHTGAYSYGHAVVPRNAIIDAIRTQAFRDMVTLYPKSAEETKAQILTHMTRQLNFMRIPKKDHPKPMEVTADLAQSLAFLHSVIGDPVFAAQKNKLLRQLQHLERSDVKPEYREEQERLLAELTRTANYAERLQLFLDSDYFAAKAQVKDFLATSVSELGSWEGFFEHLITSRRAPGEPAGENFRLILQYLLEEEPDQALALLAYVETHHPDALETILMLAKAGIREPDLYYRIVDTLWARDTPAARANAIWVLTYARQADKSLYSEEDFDYFDQVLDEGNMTAIGNLIYNVGDYLPVNAEKTIALIGRLIDLDKDGSEHENLLYHLFGDKALTKAHADQLRDLLYQHCIDLPLETFLHAALKFLEDRFGFEALLDFLRAKFKAFAGRDELIRSYQNLKYYNPETDAGVREDQYVALIDWFARLSDAEQLTYADMLKVLQPHGPVPDSLRDKLLAAVAEHAGDERYLTGIAMCLRALRIQDSAYLRLAATIGNALAALPGCTLPDIRAIFNDGFYGNFGSRRKVGAGPFPQDVSKQAMLDEALETLELAAPVREVLLEIRANVARDIEWEKDEDLKNW
ncbi:hypothetical protein SAMN05216464_10838 [Mucilaginibacter pineti]|uniref:SMEK domain-containing protein n=1 Tax=Mucilaginibacter pineti TaxID=1391627 RepID=A0A1G7EI82_9SPHI|nr:SMEK domain-containing protein [Mucilaginibacter pineti]SDE63364.1 hypothetical protein SAMN05216464_10838 [Mucilaginibacter pineti]